MRIRNLAQFCHALPTFELNAHMNCTLKWHTTN
jgi:hypothetical protein